MKSCAENRRRPRQDRGAGARAERRLAAASSEGARDVSALALLKEHDQQEQETGEHVQSSHQVIEHNG